MPSLKLNANAWHGDGVIELHLPDNWQLDILAPDDAAGLTPGAVAAALETPIGSPSLAELARDRVGAVRSRASALIVVDDLGRPTRAEAVIPSVLAILTGAGVSPDRISFLVATGSHRPLKEEEIRRKLGSDVAARFPVANHDAFGSDLCHLGRLPSGLPVIVNRRIAEADLVVGISCVIPHSLTGFSGGGKLLLPGASGLLSIAHLHSFERKRRRGAIDRTTALPDARDAVGEYAVRAGLNFSINAVVNSNREIAGLFCGHPVDAHRQATLCARKVYRTPIPPQLRASTDILLLSAYPMDADPVQVSKPLWPISLFPGAQPILIDPACDGAAYHGWNEFKRSSLINLAAAGVGRLTKSARSGDVGPTFWSRTVRAAANRRFRAELERRPTDYDRFLSAGAPFTNNNPAKRVSANRIPLWICSDAFPEYKRVQQFPKGRLFPNWQAVLQGLGQGPRRVTVFPCTPLQLPD
jgi:hypothetical protein